LKRGYYVLIGGAAVLAAGIVLTAVWALPLAQQISKETSIAQGIKLSPGESHTMSLNVTDASKTISVVVNADNNGQLAAKLTDPKGRKYIDTTISKQDVLNATGTDPGVYNLELTNTGSQPTEINVIFGHIPGVGDDGVTRQTFYGVAAGAGIVIAGIITMIVGVVIVVIDRRR
jgi:hypothetical protein